MKKVYIGIAALLIVVIGGIVTVLMLRQGTSTSENSPQASFITFEACKLLTKDKAVELLGTTATLGQEPSPSNSEDLKVTNCVYTNNAGDFKDIISVSALVRSPLTQAGAKSNEEVFDITTTVGDTAVGGYGEKATWNRSTGQLNILKDKNWIIITLGKVQPASRTLDDARKAADLLLK